MLRYPYHEGSPYNKMSAQPITITKLGHSDADQILFPSEEVAELNFLDEVSNNGSNEN